MGVLVREAAPLVRLDESALELYAKGLIGAAGRPFATYEGRPLDERAGGSWRLSTELSLRSIVSSIVCRARS